MADVIEAARSGRAKCRRCGEALPKGGLRFGEEVDNTFGEGKAMRWFHLRCAAEKRPAKLIESLAETEVSVPELDVLEAAARAGIANPLLTTVRGAERAKTGRARCQHCRESIAKGGLRIAVEREEDGVMASVSFVHARCGPAYVGPTGLREKLHRVSDALSADDLAELDGELDGASQG